MVETLPRSFRCATSWCDLDITLVLAIVTMSFKILSGLFLEFCEVQKGRDTG